MFYRYVQRLICATLPIALIAVSASAMLAGPVRAGSLAPTNPEKLGLSAQRLKLITEYFDNEVKRGKIPGAIVLIQRRGQPAYYEAFGFRDAATKAPMTADTIFTLYSMTKPITSVAAMMLAERGKLTLADEVGQYIHGFYTMKVGDEKQGPDGKPVLDLVAANRPIQIHDLMRQTAGIPYSFLAYGLVKKLWEDADLESGKFTNEEVANKIATLPLIAQPGEKWVYGHSTDVLGRVIEVASGKSLYEFEKENLLDPLGMTSTSFFVTDPAKKSLIARPFPDKNDKLAFDPAVVTKWESGGGGMVSTAADFGRFLQMLLNGGELNGKRVVSRKTVEFMLVNHIGEGTGVQPWAYYFPGAGYGFGLGFAIRTAEAGVSHWPGTPGEYEWSGGSGTYFLVDPKEEMFAILMIQSPSQRGRIQSALKNLIYGALK